MGSIFIESSIWGENCTFLKFWLTEGLGGVGLGISYTEGLGGVGLGISYTTGYGTPMMIGVLPW